MRIKRFLLKILGRGPYTVDELRAAGASCGDNVYIGTRKIDLPHAFLLQIGNNVTLSDCRLLLHDASTKLALGFSKVGCIKIGNNVFVGADAIILPNVSIGDYCIIGAGAIVTKDVPTNSVVVGSPAKIICTYEEYIDKNRRMMDDSNLIYKTHHSMKDEAEKQKMRADLLNGGFGFDI